MKFRKSMLVAALSVASLGGGLAVPVVASAQTVVYFNSAPPAPRYEAVPAPRRGYVWSPGYWNARGNRHHWKAGHWEKQRGGYYRSDPTWVERNNRWELQQGRWNRGDRDGDGVPNSMDRAPRNPTLR